LERDETARADDTVDASAPTTSVQEPAVTLLTPAPIQLDMMASIDDIVVGSAPPTVIQEPAVTILTADAVKLEGTATVDDIEASAPQQPAVIPLTSAPIQKDETATMDAISAPDLKPGNTADWKESSGTVEPAVILLVPSSPKQDDTATVDDIVHSSNFSAKPDGTVTSDVKPEPHAEAKEPAVTLLTPASVKEDDIAYVDATVDGSRSAAELETTRLTPVPTNDDMLVQLDLTVHGSELPANPAGPTVDMLDPTASPDLQVTILNATDINKDQHLQLDHLVDRLRSTSKARNFGGPTVTILKPDLLDKDEVVQVVDAVKDLQQSESELATGRSAVSSG
jgi:hypothetical protein